jgi:hypothetical protein
MADDPLEWCWEESVLAKEAHEIIKHNQYYPVSSDLPSNAIDRNIVYSV